MKTSRLFIVLSDRVLPVIVWLLIAMAVTVGCDGGDEVRLNEKIPIRSSDDISPPIVHDPVYECARAVEVTGFAPGALVRVYVNATSVVGDSVSHFGFAEIQLTRPLAVGEIVTATQTADGIESAHSLIPVVVDPLPEFPDGLPRPVVASDIYECGRVVPVGGLIPGVRVIVDENGSQVGTGNAAKEWKPVWTSPLNAGGKVTARQVVCQDVPGMSPLESPTSVEVGVRSKPDPFLAPDLDESTVIVGNNSVTLGELYTGAHVQVRNGSDVKGDGWATASRNWVPLSEPIEAGWSVVGSQELCGTGAETDPATPTTRLGTPQIVGPVCDTDTYVRVSGAIINATVALLRNGAVAGLAGATPGELWLPTAEPLEAGDELVVMQYLGDIASGDSAPVTVCACSDEWLTKLEGEILGDASTGLQPVACAPTPIALFQNSDPFDVLEVTLRADFAKVNGEPNKASAKSPGTLTYTDPVSGNPVSIDCSVEARGNSRFTACAWRPLTLRFPSNPDGTLLDGTGKVIKIVTHCGFKPSDIDEWYEWLSGGTPSEQVRRVMQEFTLYHVLATMGSTSLETRLAYITYEDPSGNVLETEYGFFREREKRAAERCGYERLEEDEGDPLGVFPPNARSDFQVRFHHKFLFSHDFNPQSEHNVIRMRGPDGNEHYMPYDFDLTGIIRPDYHKNNDWTIEENGEALISWLSSWPDQFLARVQVLSLLQHEAEMRQLVSEGPVDTPGRLRLEHWFEDHIRRLKCYLN